MVLTIVLLLAMDLPSLDRKVKSTFARQIRRSFRIRSNVSEGLLEAFFRNNRNLVAAINAFDYRDDHFSYNSVRITFDTLARNKANNYAEEYRWANRLEFPFHLVPPRCTRYIVIRRNYDSIRLNFRTFHVLLRGPIFSLPVASFSSSEWTFRSEIKLFALW